MTTKKQLIIKQSTYNLYTIQYEGGGQLPKELSGSYNKKTVAQEAIEGYEASKGKTDGSKTASKS